LAKVLFDAALNAAAEIDFSVISSERTAGVISLRQEKTAGKKKYEKRINVKIKKESDTVIVTTKASSGDVSFFKAAIIGNKALEELTRNFYSYLFKELKITDPSQREVSFEDEE